MSLREAEAKYKIPRATLSKKRRGLQLKNVGRPQVFDEALEEVFVVSIATAAVWGYPLTGVDLSLIVKSYLDRQGLIEPRFKGNMPERYWLQGFLQRHRNTLTLRLSENIKRQRAGVTESTLKSYFQELKTTLVVSSTFLISSDVSHIDKINVNLENFNSHIFEEPNARISVLNNQPMDQWINQFQF